MNWMPLRYRISDLHQLTACQSNNSVDLSIHVTEFYNDAPLRGLRVSVEHKVFGTLFAYVVGSCGDIVTDRNSKLYYPELSPEQLMGELARFGFFINYEPRENLPGDQISYLLTLKQLCYDKIRHLPVWTTKLGEKVTTDYIVGFRSCKHPMWLSNEYSPDEKQFLDALKDGSAINISGISQTKKFRWGWLDYVANINDIVLDNA